MHTNFRYVKNRHIRIVVKQPYNNEPLRCAGHYYYYYYYYYSTYSYYYYYDDDD